MNSLIIGGGVSGYGAASYLTAIGQKVRLSEHAKLSPEDARRFLDLGVELRDGGHHLSHLDGISQVIVSPGVPSQHPVLLAAHARGLEVLSEIDLALRNSRARVIAVTGTNGKSTTCAMIGHLLSRLGHEVSVGGNFGDPPTLMLAEGRMKDFLVLELSSYQLEASAQVQAEAAIFTSFSHDHIARHGSLDAYFAAKWRLFSSLPDQALAIIPEAIYLQAKSLGLSLRSLQHPPLTSVDYLKGLAPASMEEAQNRLNAGFAVSAVAHLLGCPPAELTPYLADFHGLPHRCERIGYIRAQPVVNDSKSTNVESTLVALASQGAPTILLMGGKGKDEPYGPILSERSKIAVLITFGASGGDIAKELSGSFPIEEFSTLKAAMAQLSGIIARYQCGVLFSPGCASFDEFRNYEHRGDFFRQAILPLLDR